MNFKFGMHAPGERSDMNPKKILEKGAWPESRAGAYLRGGALAPGRPPLKLKKITKRAKLIVSVKSAGRLILFTSDPPTCVWWLQFTLRCRMGGGNISSLQPFYRVSDNIMPTRSCRVAINMLSRLPVRCTDRPTTAIKEGTQNRL